jgi:hypothetical protein
VFWGCLEVEKSFLVESKIFVFSVLDGASRLRVGEEKKFFRQNCHQSTMLEVACIDAGDSIGFPRRSRVHQILQGRVENFDCTER